MQEPPPSDTGTPPPPPPPPPPPEGEPKSTTTLNWAVLCHLASFAGLPLWGFGQLVGPLAVWLLKRHDHPFIDENGKESLNFQISMTIYGIVAGFLMLILIGFVLLPLVVVFDVVMVIVASIKTSNGETFRYPLTIRLVQ